MKYLTYGEYRNLGGTIAGEAAFERYALRADAVITRMTHGRVVDEKPVRNSIKYAAFDLINAIYNDEQNGVEGREVASMSNDGVSITFATGGSVMSSQRHVCIVRQYLEWELDANGTPLLYAGVDA